MGLMDIISWCLFGLIVGGLARFLMPGRQEMGCLLQIGLGVAGSFAGGFIWSLFSKSPDGTINPAGWFMSIIGALIVLYAYGKIVNPDPPHDL